MSPLTRIALVALLVGCDAATRPDDSIPQDTTAPTPSPPAPLTSTGTIAYTSLNELRLIESNGSGDHLVWAAPPVPQQSALHYTLTGTAWRPDGGEIAFSSDHEAAISIFANDIYAVRPDGVGLRRVTNAPALASYAAMKKGTVRVSVQNVNAPPGPYFIYVQGAPEPQLATISAGTSRVFTFTNVADFGSSTQLPVAINGAFRYIGDAAVDVQPNQTVDAGSITITAFGGIEGYDATDPFWRADGTKVGYLGPLCFIEEAPSAGAFGYTNTALLDREKLGLHVCALAHIHLTRHTEGGVEQFEREIATCPEVTECYSTTGESDYTLKIVAPDIKAYDTFLHERIFKIPAVAQVRTSVVLREIKFDTQLPL